MPSISHISVNTKPLARVFFGRAKSAAGAIHRAITLFSGYTMVSLGERRSRSKQQSFALIGGGVALCVFLQWLYFGNQIGFLVQDLAQEVTRDLPLHIVLIVGFTLALLRGAQVIQLQKQILASKEIELSLHGQALKVHNIVCVTDLNSVILDANENFLSRLGYSRGDIIGRAHKSLESWVQDQRHSDLGPGIFSRNDIWTGECRLLDKRGRTVQMLVTIVPITDEYGRHVRNAVLYDDLTSAREEEFERKLCQLLDLLPDRVSVVRASDKKFLHVNHAKRSSFSASRGWEGDSYLNKTLGDADPEFDETAFEAMIEALTSGEQSSVVYEARRGNSTVEVNLVLDTHWAKEPAYICVERDITRRKEVEQQLRDLVAIVSHELRTPLTSITGSLGLLRSGAIGAVSPKIATVIDIAFRNCEKMLSVANDILDFEKSGREMMNFPLSIVELSATVSEAIEMNRGLEAKYDVAFVGIGLSRAAGILGNCDRLIQAISNLLSNAAKFSPPGGVVRVSMSESPTSWRISVADQGPGIAKDARGFLFKKFSQIQPADGVPRKGSGLGLNIVRTIVERHHGKVDFESEVGHGATFHIDLPKVS